MFTQVEYTNQNWYREQIHKQKSLTYKACTDDEQNEIKC